jgi:hypothetical protein
MKRIALAAAAVAFMAALVLAGSSQAFAMARSGLGVYVGVGGETGSVKQSGSATTNYSLDTGDAAGVDLQLKLGMSWALGLFGEFGDTATAHCGSKCNSSSKISGADEGLELRYWPGNTFIGVRALNHTSQFSSTNSGVTSKQNYYGSGTGVTVGVEGSSGLFVKLTYDMDSAVNKQAGQANQTDDSNVTRLYVGYRF